MHPLLLQRICSKEWVHLLYSGSTLSLLSLVDMVDHSLTLWLHARKPPLSYIWEKPSNPPYGDHPTKVIKSFTDSNFLFAKLFKYTPSIEGCCGSHDKGLHTRLPGPYSKGLHKQRIARKLARIRQGRTIRGGTH